MSEGPPQPAKGPLLTLFFLAFGFMVFQIVILRELRYALNTLFTLTPFVFSIVIVLMGVGSFAARRVKLDVRRALRWAILAAPVALLPLFLATLLLARFTVDRTAALAYTGAGPAGGSDYIGSVIAAFVSTSVLGFGAVFVLQGFIFALYFRQGRDDGRLSRFYALDLMASGIGALLGGVLAFRFTPIESALLAAILLFAAVVAGSGFLRISSGCVALAGAMVAVLVLSELAGGVLTWAESPEFLGRHVAYSKWTPYRRIDVVDTESQLVVYTDGLKFQGYEKRDRIHDKDPRSIPAKLIENSEKPLIDVLVIGAGSGSDVRVLRDRVRTPVRITAVELDEGFIEMARHFPDLWDTYSTARIVVGEGRYFLERTRDTFDVLVYAYVDPQSAISKLGLPDANFLYTARGLRRAYDHVREGGYFAITRIFVAEQSDEFFKRLDATLRAAGIPESETRLYRSRDTMPWGYYGRLATATVLIRKGSEPPSLGGAFFEPVAPAPGGRPTTDLYPFSLVTDAWFGALWRYLLTRPILAGALALLLLALVVRLAGSAGYRHFFVLGFGSFLVESLMLLYSFLLIGNPTLSAAIAVGFLLICGAAGSFYSDRLEKHRAFLVAVPFVMAAYALTAPFLNQATIGLPVSGRVAAFAAHLLAPSFVAGAMFPASLRSFADQDVSGMFFIDLVGCALAPIVFWIAMSLSGAWLVSALGVAAYALVSATLLRRA